MAALKKNKETPPAIPIPFPIVGVGASTSGLDAFKRLLKSIPEDSGMAYVLVQHLDPTHEVSQKSVIKQNISLTLNRKQTLVTIQVVPLHNTIDPHFLILFSKNVPCIEAHEAKGKNSSQSQKIKKDAQVRIQQLENELSQAREDMRSITDEQQSANQELQSANEELLSSSEEMQTLNEELETSKEELQTTNEKLTIINHELLDKQEQFYATGFYSEAIVTTMREPLIVLDKALRIKTANASFYKKFNLEETEIENKLFYEIQNHQFDNTLLRSLLEKILPQKKRIEDFEIKLSFTNTGELIKCTSNCK